jgi:hypothetical protein
MPEVVPFPVVALSNPKTSTAAKARLLLGRWTLKRRSSTVVHAAVFRVGALRTPEVVPFPVVALPRPHPFEVASADSGFLTGLSARFGRTRVHESLRPE